MYRKTVLFTGLVLLVSLFLLNEFQIVLAERGKYLTPPSPPIAIESPTATNYSGSVPLVFSLATNGTFDLPFTAEGGPGGDGKGVWGIKRFSYSLDGVTNVSIVGNTTLDRLAAGEHRLIVYAYRWVYYGLYFGGFEDTIASEQITFFADTPQTETTTAYTAEHSQPDLVPLTSLALAIAFVAGLVVVLKKRHSQRGTALTLRVTAKAATTEATMNPMKIKPKIDMGVRKVGSPMRVSFDGIGI